MRNVTCVGSILAALMVAGCGGGGGNSGLNSTPVAPDSVSKSTSLINVTQNDDFAASTKQTSFTAAKGSGTITSVGSVSGAANTYVHYDVASKRYTVGGLSSTPSFSEANKSASKSNAVLSVYEKTSGSRNETFLLFNPGAGNSSLALTYASYGAWLIMDDRSTSIDANISFFTFGTRTAAADMPRTGTASYNTIMDGIFADSSGFYSLSGTGSFTADFGASTIAFQANPFAANQLGGPSKYLATFAGSGAIDSNTARFNGNTTNADGLRLDLNGYFYGPGAAEMAGTFSLSGMNATGVGAIAGKKN